MARKPKRARGTGTGRPSRAFLAMAYAFGLLCAGGGVLILVFGTGFEAPSGRAARGDVTLTGVLMIVLGLVAVGVTAVIQRTR
ncbi:MAG: hypothetical protein ACLF0G_06685 [Candidatus Brocadiia bacterium]